MLYLFTCTKRIIQNGQRKFENRILWWNLSANKFVTLFLNTFLVSFATYSVESEQKKFIDDDSCGCILSNKKRCPHTLSQAKELRSYRKKKKYEHICCVHLNMGHHTGCSLSNIDIFLIYHVLLFLSWNQNEKSFAKKIGKIYPFKIVTSFEDYDWNATLSDIGTKQSY